MNKTQLIIVWAIALIFQFSIPVFAYFENYPPYKFGNEFKNHFKLQDLSGNKPIYEDINYRYKDKKGSFELIKTDPEKYFGIDSLVIKINNKTILNDKVHWHVTGFYKADIDKNGFDDYIVISNSVGNGLLGFAFGKIYIFLGKPDGDYQTIYFELVYPSEKDFIDMDKDGRSEIIIGGYENIGEHAYWTYNIYEIKNYKLVNANTKFKGFPKFIWFTYKNNDNDTSHLTPQQRDAIVNKTDASIKYGEIK